MRFLYMLSIIVVTLSCSAKQTNNIEHPQKVLYGQAIKQQTTVLHEWYEVIDGNVVYMNFELNALMQYKRNLISQKEKISELDVEKKQIVTDMIYAVNEQIYQNRKIHQPVFQRSFQSEINDQIFYCKRFPKMAHYPCSISEIEK